MADSSTDTGPKVSPDSTLPRAIDHSPGKTILVILMILLLSYLIIIYGKRSNRRQAKG